MRKFLLLSLFLLVFTPPGGPFVRTYKAAPLATVLHDIETHFSLQILYRSQDVANAPAFTGTINTSDYQVALRQVLGKRFTFTVNKNMVVIKAVAQPSQPKPPTSPPPKKSKPPVQTDVTSAPSPADTLVTAGEDSTLKDSVQIKNVEMEPPIIVYSKELSFSPKMDTVPLLLQAKIPQLPKRTVILPLRYHVFHAAVSVGYGSELMPRLDLRYGYYFHKNWGVGAGVNFAYAAKHDGGSWREEGRIGLPLVVNMRYMLNRKWGIRGSLGASASFPVASGPTGTGISGREIDVIPFLEVDAMYPASAHADCLFGLYAQLSAIAATPWSVGVHFGVEIGKRGAYASRRKR